MQLRKFQELIRDVHHWSEITKDATVVVRVAGVEATERPVRNIRVRNGVVIVEY